MLRNHIFIILASTLFISCAKNEVTIPINPEPCFYADRINVNRNDTITFFNCSKNAVVVHFTVVKRGDSADFYYQSFDNSNIIYKVFNDSGLFDAIINPVN